jgi:hypothetical protein
LQTDFAEIGAGEGERSKFRSLSRAARFPNLESCVMGGDSGPVDHRSAFACESRACWPWQFHVLNAERTVAELKLHTTAERFVELVVAMSNCVEIADANKSKDYAAFATPPNGWKRGEKSMMRKLHRAVVDNGYEAGARCDDMFMNCGWEDDEAGALAEAEDGTVLKRTAPVYIGPGIGVFQEAKSDPLRVLVQLVGQIDDMAFDVPFNEWRHARDDFRPLALYPLIVHRQQRHLKRLNGELIRPKTKFAETTNCVALHKPRGSRDTPLKSARVYQATDWLNAIRAVYTGHRSAVLKGWQSHDADPLFKFLTNPTRETKNAALIILYAMLGQQQSPPPIGGTASETGDVDAGGVDDEPAPPGRPGRLPKPEKQKHAIRANELRKATPQTPWKEVAQTVNRDFGLEGSAAYADPKKPHVYSVWREVFGDKAKKKKRG